MKYIIVLVLLVLPLISYSQLKLEGTVKDNNNESVAYANIVVYDQSGKLLTGIITNEEGTFSLNLTLGVYKIEVSYIGFKTLNTEVDLIEDLKLDDIKLELAEYKLAEVTLTGRKRLFTRKPDRLVFNVENNISASGGDALDALQVSPGLIVADEGISMIGKSSMRVFINDKPIQLSGEELTGFLSSIPADDIKSVEIITNPPAKYEAEGNSGIINIIYKKGRLNSWSNSTSGSYTQSVFSYYRVSNNFKYQKGKTDLLFSLSGTVGDYLIEQSLDIDYDDLRSFNTLEQQIKRDDISARLLFDYKISEKSTLGFQYLGMLGNPDMDYISGSSNINNGGVTESFTFGDGLNDRSNSNHSLNVHYIVKLDTLGRKISVDLDYFNSDFGTDNTLESTEFVGNQSGNLIFSNLVESSQKITNYSARVDVDHPLKFMNFSYGGRLSLTKTDNVTDNFNTITGSQVFDPQLSNNFKFEEINQALYLSASKSLGKKVSVKAGLRMENTLTEGVSVKLNQTNTNDYFKLFPTFYLSYEKNDNNTFSINYGKRINRPSFRELDPARIYFTNINYVEGNPFLNPSFIDNYELSYDYKGMLGMTLYLSREDDGFGQVPILNNNVEDQIFNNQNFFTQYTYGGSGYFYFNKLKWFESQNVLYITQSESDFFANNVELTEQNGLRVHLGTYNTFMLNQSKTLRAQINFWHNTPYKSNLYDYSSNSKLDFVLRYSMLKNKLQLSAGVYDILNTRQRTFTSFINGIKSVNDKWASYRYFRLSLVYNTGNKKIKVKERDFGNEEEKERAID